MASVLDHRRFREEQTALSQLHDEWMHSSTGYTNPLGEYDYGPFDTVQQKQLGPWDLPPVNKGISLGFSPSDMRSLIQRHTNDGGVSTPNTDGSTSGDSTSGSTQGRHHRQQHQRGGRGNRQRHGGGGGGGGAAGAKALGPTPKLGNVPYTTTPASGGTSPIIAIITIGVIGITIYFVWHKYRQSRSEDKDLSAKGR